MSERSPSDERLRVYERILASSRDHLSLVGDDYVYRVVNDAYLAAHGLRREEIEGHRVAELLGEATFEQVIRPQLDRSLAGEVIEYEDWFEFRDIGRRAMAVAYFPYYGVDERVATGVLVRATDITDERTMQASLRDQDERLEHFLEAAGVGTWDWLVDRNELTWSPQVLDLFGVAAEDFDGTYEAFLGLVDEEDRAALAGRIERALDDVSGGDGYEAEYRVVRRGEVRWHYARGAVLRHEDGRPRRMLGIVNDISERKSLEAQLSHSQKLDAIGQLAGGIAHDFNNLLTAIVGGASLGRHARRPGDVDRALDLISEAAGRATTLVHSLLTFARAQPNDPQTIDVVGRVGELKDMLELLLPEHIELRLPSGAPLHARIDPAQLGQVIVNLVVNAKDAMPDGGLLEITARREQRPPGGSTPGGTFVALAVRDQGQGIAPELHSRVFEPFFSTKPTGAGSGLGLATCHGVAERAGGAIRLDSVPGEGTCVTVLLPEAAAPAEPLPDRPGAEPPRGRGQVIVLVEDDAIVRLTVGSLLEGLGYDVRSYESGEGALAALSEPEADVALLLTDVMMPDMTGPELIRSLRERRPSLPAILTSGYALDTTRSLPRGARFLAKPFSRRQLAELVSAALTEAQGLA